MRVNQILGVLVSTLFLAVVRFFFPLAPALGAIIMCVMCFCFSFPGFQAFSPFTHISWSLVV